MRALVWASAVLCGCAFDPAPSIWTGKGEARSQTCTRLTQARAHQLYPGVVPDLPPRGLVQESDALACERSFIDDGERPARDEAILSRLRVEVAELTQLAAARHPGAVTWHVDAFYPDVAVASKIAVAARSELVDRGRAVSDRTPVIAAGDIAVLSRMAPQDAYPLACARFFKEQSLGDNDVFLGLMLVDPRETTLHAGVCRQAQWRWLR